MIGMDEGLLVFHGLVGSLGRPRVAVAAWSDARWHVREEDLIEDEWELAGLLCPAGKQTIYVIT
jgi:hypothetical protein